MTQLGSKTLKRDTFVTAVAVLLLFGAFHFGEFFEWLYEFTRAHEEWELDEFILLLFALPLPLAWFAFSRMRENVALYQAHLTAERELAHFRKVESLGVLAGGLAHELNNQLQPVLSMSELLLKRTPETDPGHRKLELVHDGAKRAKDTVSKVLVFARREADQGKTCEVGEVIRRLNDLLVISCSSKIDLRVELGAMVGVVPVSATDLEGVIVNLFNNAAHAMEDRSGSLVIGATATHLDADAREVGLVPGGYVRIEVRDEGKGISEEELGRVFDPFFTTKEVGEGTGLGLSQVKGLVEKAGGGISLDSRVGQGTTVTVYLPATVPSAGASDFPRQEDENLEEG